MTSQSLAVIHELNALSVNPGARVIIEYAEVIVELSDEVTKMRVSFSPYQSVRVTTADCFALSDEMYISPRTIMEVRESEWIRQLRESQSRVDETATFMNEARHFVVPCDNIFIEVVAWRWQVLTT